MSQVGGREGEFSPDEQRDRIADACKRDGMKLLETIPELDVSGGTPLDQREGLRTAIEAVEAGRVDVIVAAYFDRLVRSLSVQEELLTRVEKAGGQVLALDMGTITAATAGQWLSSTLIGAVNEYQRRSAAERSADVVARSVSRGVLPWPNIPPGFTRGTDGRLVPTAEAPVVVEAFEMRAGGATLAEVRDFLRRHGIDRSYHGVQHMLGSRLYIGEIHFGALVNVAAHPAIIDLDLFRQVQRVKVSRGRRAKSDQLLARLGVLRCASCGARLVVGTQTQNGRRYHFYRCPPVGDCTERVTIGAPIVEPLVVDAVKRALAGRKGKASAEEKRQRAEAQLAKAQADLTAAIRAFAGFEDEAATRDRLRELRVVRDEKESALATLGGTASLSIDAVEDWDRLSLDARRRLIGAVVDRVEVAPGRGGDRVTISLKK